jgi:hypothetical protein
MVSVENSKGKGALEKPTCNWEDNIKTDFRKTGWGVVDWIHLTQDMDHWRAIVNMVMNFRFP